MSFSVSKTVNPPIVFLARRSELTDRFDPELVLFRRKTYRFKHPVRELRTLFTEPPQYGAGERGLVRESPDQPRYIRITDIDENGVLNDELGATAANVEQRYLLEEDDLLVARSGNTVGKSYLHKSAHAPYLCFFAGYLIRLRFKRDQVLPEYVFAITQLPYYKEWVRAIRRAAGQPNINAQEYSSLDIPVPELAFQQNLVLLFQEAYAKKKRLDADARDLFRRVNTIVLDELGIELPGDARNTLRNRIFSVSLRDVTGGRLDPEMVLFKKGERRSKYPVRRLSEVFAESPQYGAGERGLDRDDPQEARYIRITDIDDFGRLSTEIGATAATIEPQYVLQNDDLLVARSGNTVGKAYLHKSAHQPYSCFYAGYLIRLRFNTAAILPDFVFAVTQSSYYQTWVRAVQRRAGQPNINAEEYSGFLIPLPPLSVQRVIVAKMQAARADAQELQRRALAEFEGAKKAIEALILGTEGATA